MKLSPNFTLDEMLDSQTAVRKGFTEQFTPDQEVIANLTALCINVLQPIRNLLPDGYIRVSSGYRCERLNATVGGKPNSQHLDGEAADIQYINKEGKMDNMRIIMVTLGSKIPYDQLLDEYGLAWVHISHVRDGKNRKEFKRIK